MPSRWGKSETTIAWIAWLIMQYPTLKVVILTHSQRLSKRFSSRLKDILEHLQPELIQTAVTNQMEYIEFKAGGYVLTASPGSGVSGYGANLIVIDDLVRSSEEAMSIKRRDTIEEIMDSVFGTRVEPFTLPDEPDVKHMPFTIGIGTLYTTDDWLYQHHDDCGEDYKIKLSALDENGESRWPETWTTEALLEKKRKMSSYNWQAMYEADPLNRDGNYLKTEWLTVEPNPLANGPFKHTGIFVDPAARTGKSNDNTVAIVAHKLYDNRVYVSEMFVYKKTVFQSIDFLSALYNRVQPDMFKIEDVGFASALVEGLQNMGVPVMGWHPGQLDKVARVQNQLEQPLEARLIVFKDEVLENETFITEYERFPQYSHDDTVDCLAICAEHMVGFKSGNPYTPGADGAHYYEFSSGYGKQRSRRPKVYNPYSVGGF